MKNPLTLGLLFLWVLVSSTTSVVGQYLYWVDARFLSPALGRSDLTGGNVTTVPLASKSLPEGLALDAMHSRIYFSDLAFAQAHIQSRDLNLTGPGTIDSMGSALRGIAIDPLKGRIYWTTSNLSSGAQILKANLNGTGTQIVYAFAPGAGANLRGIALVDSTIYWADFSSGKIRAGNVSGTSAPVDFISGLSGPVGVAVGKDGYIYWTEANANLIRRRTLIPGNSTTLVSGLSTPQYLAIDSTSGQMFWTETGVPRIRKANLNGTNVQTLALTVTHPTGIAVSTQTTAVNEDEQLPQNFALLQNYPNPFNPVTTIGFRVPASGFRGAESSARNPEPTTRNIRLAVYDMLGREVAKLVDERMEAGAHEVKFDGSALSSGVYFYQMRAGDFIQTKRLVLLK